jgi:hypothetical protein
MKKDFATDSLATSLLYLPSISYFPVIRKNAPKHDSVLLNFALSPLGE